MLTLAIVVTLYVNGDSSKMGEKTLFVCFPPKFARSIKDIIEISF